MPINKSHGFKEGKWQKGEKEKMNKRKKLCMAPAAVPDAITEGGWVTASLRPVFSIPHC